MLWQGSRPLRGSLSLRRPGDGATVAIADHEHRPLVLETVDAALRGQPVPKALRWEDYNGRIQERITDDDITAGLLSELHQSNNVNDIINSFLEDLIINFLKEKEIYERENQIEAFKTKIKPIIGKSFDNEEFENIAKLKNKEFENIIKKRFNEFRSRRSKILSEATNLELEKRIFLQTVDFLWRSHLQYLEHLRQVVGLRGYAQKDPLDEFKKDAFKLFEDLLNKIKIDFIIFLNNLEVVANQKIQANDSNKKLSDDPKCLLVIKKGEKVSRNEKCLATGKKYKHCCGAL